MRPLASIIIPIAPYHYTAVDTALDSAYAQDAPCEVIPMYDSREQGAAYTRNAGAAKAQAPFLVFLDADDVLAPDFVSATVERWLAGDKRNTYIYTDWTIPDGRVRYANEDFDILKGGMAHIITTLLPRQAFEYVGGFDTTMQGGEDEDLYIRLQIAGLCPKRLPRPLVNYRLNLGQSATSPHFNPHYETFVKQHQENMIAKYGRYASMCCGSSVVATGQIANEQFEGAVQVEALYPPRTEVGVVSGKKYPRVGHGTTLWVDKRDVQAKPGLWKIIQDSTPIAPDVDFVLQLAQTAKQRTA